MGRNGEHIGSKELVKTLYIAREETATLGFIGAEAS
jgi:hypothetical protein